MMCMKNLTLAPDKKVFFASDFHLGAPDYAQSRLRERKVVHWLESIQSQAGAIFLLGDIFDFWFEYRHAVPKGYVRLLGKLAQITDQGIPVFVFVGNHDMWMFDYLTREMDIPVFYQPQAWCINGKKFWIGHGDGLGPGDYTYKFLKRLFRNRLFQWLFARLHPNFGIGLANFFSRRSRSRNLRHHKDEVFLGNKEWLWQYCQQMEKTQAFDYYVFGHRHLPLDLPVGPQSRYINLGEWLKANTYAVFDGQEMQLTKFESQWQESPSS
ncbi:MAG: UDP-2,3-diacylglucosamine diphosphatase [Microscillaceae bacterium]|nr:UDP-2,3-diacylglucosamine diphosphatase [Microscillaceae bacterium]